MSDFLIKRILKNKNLFRNINIHTARKLFVGDEFNNISDHNKWLRRSYEDLILKMDHTKSDVNSSEVFANNVLKISDIKIFGFEFESVLFPITTDILNKHYMLIREKLINYQYPQELSLRSYSRDFPTRGILFDVKTGCFLKLDYAGFINRYHCFKGKTLIDDDQFNQFYPKKFISEEYQATNLKPMNDSFSLSLICIIADLIEIFNSKKIYHLDYVTIFQSIMKIHNQIKNDGQLYDIYLKQLENKGKLSDIKDIELIGLLDFLKSNSKELFVLTDSPSFVVDKMLNNLIGKDWKRYFSFIGTDINKSTFFTSRSTFKSLSKDGNPSTEIVHDLFPQTIYIEGSYNQLMLFKKWKDKKILFIGNNIVDNKIYFRPPHWYYCVVINEIKKEIMKDYTHDNSLLIYLIEVLTEMGKNIALNNESDYMFLNTVLDIVEESWLYLNRSKNPNFGSMFRSSDLLSIFSVNLMEQSDLYTSHLSNFASYPPETTFLPNRLSLPHEPIGRGASTEFFNTINEII